MKNQIINKYIYFYLEDIWDLIKFRFILIINFTILGFISIFLFFLLNSLFPIKKKLIYNYLIEKNILDDFNLEFSNYLRLLNKQYKNDSNHKISKIKNLNFVKNFQDLENAILTELVNHYVITSHQYINKFKYVNQLRFLEQNSTDKIAIKYTDKINQLIYNIEEKDFSKYKKKYVNILETNCYKKHCSVDFIISQVENNNIIKKEVKTAKIEFDFYLANLNKNNLYRQTNKQTLNFKVSKYTFK